MSVTTKDYYGAGDTGNADETLDALNFTPKTFYVSCHADCCANGGQGTRKELEAAGWQIGTFSSFCCLHSYRKAPKALSTLTHAELRDAIPSIASPATLAVIERLRLAGELDAARDSDAELAHVMAGDEWDRYFEEVD